MGSDAADELLPWLAQAGEMGDDVLELGPGPGLTTDLLMQLTARVTAVPELDEQLAKSLAERLAGTNVTVLCGDATHIDLPAERFSAVVCLSMLHHVPTPALQDQVLHEVFRVLRPQGRFLAVDAVDTDLTRQLHIDDTFTPLDPATVTERLAAAGFSDIRIDRAEHRIRLSARKY